jgi:crotonobetainyl-CoA:carnitine CoA-transferase CaiB-like acyl-CoA transferase
MTLPLDGLKVVEFSEHFFVPAAAAALAEWGADVVKVERHDGDALRHLRLTTGDGTDYLFQLCNRNKRDIALDVETAAGREIFEQLIADADVFITNHLPRVMRRLRTSRDDIFAINPRIVYARGSGQGTLGPDAEAGGNDGVSFWSRAGVAFMLSDPDADEPIPQRPAIGDAPTGMALAAGILAGYIQAHRTGHGVEVNTSLLNAGMWTLGPDIAYASLTGENPPRRAITGMAAGPLTSRYRTADGRVIQLSMTNEPRYWPKACRALSLEDLIDKYPDDDERRAVGPQLRERFDEVVSRLTAAQVTECLQREECIFAFINGPVDVLADKQAHANGYLLTHPGNPSLRLPAIPAQFDEQAPTMRNGAPDIGEHSEEILRGLGYNDERISQLCADGTIRTAASPRILRSQQ